MINNNDDRIIKKGSKVFSKNYIAQKKSKEKEQKPKSKRFYTLLIVIFLLGLFYNLYMHPYMKINNIYINGNVVTDDTEIIKKLGSPLDKNILFYNPRKYEDDIKTLDYISEAKVRKVFPKILSVKVSEDFPLFYTSKNGQATYITNNGIVTDKVNENIKNKLIEVKLNQVQTTIGNPITGSDAINQFIKEISASSYVNDLSQLNLENKLDIGIMLKDIEVKFGDLNNISYKIKLLEQVLLDIKNKGLEVEKINLNNGDNPLVVVKENSFSDSLNN